MLIIMIDLLVSMSHMQREKKIIYPIFYLDIYGRCFICFPFLYTFGIFFLQSRELFWISFQVHFFFKLFDKHVGFVHDSSKSFIGEKYTCFLNIPIKKSKVF